MTVFGRKSHPFQQSTCQQLPVAKGPAAGGEALKFAAPPKGEQGVMKSLVLFLQILKPRGTPPLPPAPPNLMVVFRPFFGPTFGDPFCLQMDPKGTPKGTQNRLKSAKMLPGTPPERVW